MRVTDVASIELQRPLFCEKMCSALQFTNTCVLFRGAEAEHDTLDRRMVRGSEYNIIVLVEWYTCMKAHCSVKSPNAPTATRTCCNFFGCVRFSLGLRLSVQELAAEVQRTTHFSSLPSSSFATLTCTDSREFLALIEIINTYIHTLITSSWHYNQCVPTFHPQLYRALGCLRHMCHHGQQVCSRLLGIPLSSLAHASAHDLL